MIFYTLAAAAALLLAAAARLIPGFADTYMGMMNPLLRNSLGRLTGLLPFSLAELLILLIPLFLLRLLYLKFIKKREIRFLKNAFRIGAVLLLLFVLNEDVYFRAARFAVKSGLDRSGYTTEELIEVSEILVDEIHTWSGKVQRDNNGIMYCDPFLSSRIRNAMTSLGDQYECLSGWYPAPKPVFLSSVLSHMDLTGIYSIFTVEANYNRDMPEYNLPFTMCHELSHLRGIMSEKEANFIGWLAPRCTEDPDLRYSAALLGWIYCGNELYVRDRDAWYRLAVSLPEEARHDLDYNTAFWDSYHGTVSETTEQLNDAYLKAEGLMEGTASYDLVTDLIVAWHLNARPDASSN